MDDLLSTGKVHGNPQSMDDRKILVSRISEHKVRRT
jgi:hypothetical protein